MKDKKVSIKTIPVKEKPLKLDMSFEEALNKALSTPVKKKKKK